MRRNQTKLHEELAGCALTWLRNKAIRMQAGSEVMLRAGYVADAFALCSLWPRVLKKYCLAAGLEPMTVVTKWKQERKIDVYSGKVVVYSGDVANYFACVFEAKAERGDFLSTFGPNPGTHVNRHTPVGSLHWCVAAKGIVKDPAELPEFWGLLEPYGAGLHELKMPRIVIQPEDTTMRFAHTLLWLRETGARRAEKNLRKKCRTCPLERTPHLLIDKDNEIASLRKQIEELRAAGNLWKTAYENST